MNENTPILVAPRPVCIASASGVSSYGPSSGFTDISLDPFTVDNGIMTPTLKIRRKNAYAKYKVDLDALHTLGDPSGAQAFKL